MKLIENEKYYYDAVAAERPIKFIEKYLVHYEGEFAGQPFLLLDWQKEIIRILFGWKRRDNHRRRFKELYLETAKGSGKSPFLTAIGLYMFAAEQTQGAFIVSAATDFQQANITFDFAKKFIKANERLTELTDIKQYEILLPDTNSTWKIVSGTAEGKHGFRPTCVLMDEAHEWQNRKLYDNLTSNLTKRNNTLLLVATNAGSSRSSICWKLHEDAEKVLSGTSKVETLLPVIFAAPKDAKIDDPEAWRAANPSLGIIVTTENLAAEALRATENPALEARFRRFYLSQWIEGADKWLDIGAWEACKRAFPTSEVAELPMYLGLDLSLSDDFTALSRVWVGEKYVYVRVQQWVPAKTAWKYDDQEGIPVADWVKDKSLKLLDSDTIDPRFHARLAKLIIKLSEKYQLESLQYDPHRAGEIVGRAEKAGITCIPIKQDILSLSHACLELERRLKDRTIVIYPGGCLDWQAGNVEVIRDNNGNIRPRKEHAGGNYGGRRASKIDGIASIVIALARATKHRMIDRTETCQPGILFI